MARPLRVGYFQRRVCRALRCGWLAQRVAQLRQQPVKLDPLAVVQRGPRRKVVAIGDILGLLAQRAALVGGTVAVGRLLDPAARGQVGQRRRLVLDLSAAERKILGQRLGGGRIAAPDEGNIIG